MSERILAIDQGTSSTKVLLFDREGNVVQKATAPLQTEYYPDGRVEQDAEAILESVREATAACLKAAPGSDHRGIAAIAISNQRETFVLWDQNGNPVYPAVVWACKRSVGICNRLKADEPWLSERTGLLADPYFSGTKLLWLLENEPGLAGRIAAGEIFFGTVDTWLLYRLSNGKHYATDHSNASRTLLFNLHSLEWDAEILEKWGLGGLHLPEVRSSSGDFGSTDLFGLLPRAVPVSAMIGDSHASLFGEACFAQGDTKITMGTGCSLLQNTGTDPAPATNGLLSTIGWSTPEGVVFAREGAIVACGSMVEWLQSLGMIENAEDTERLAREATDSEVLLIPAFSGLGAPFWQMDRKASFHGLTFGAGTPHLVRATLESICFQIRAVLDAMASDGGHAAHAVAMHGGLSRNGFIREELNSLLAAEIRIQDNPDISAQGAAMLAGLQAGIYQDLAMIKSNIKTKVLGKSPTESAIMTQYQKWLELVQPDQPTD